MGANVLVGAADADITPAIGAPMGGYGRRQGVAEGIGAPLRCHAVVVDDGTTPVGLVVCDLCAGLGDLGLGGGDLPVHLLQLVGGLIVLLGEGVDLLARGLDLGLEGVGLRLGVGDLVGGGGDRGDHCGTDGTGSDDCGHSGHGPTPPTHGREQTD